MPATLSNSLRVARLTNDGRSILLSTTANVLRRAHSAIRLVALVRGINAATDYPCCYPHGTAVPAQREIATLQIPS